MFNNGTGVAVMAAWSPNFFAKMWGKEKRNRKKLPRTKVVEVECWNRTVETGIVIGKVMQWDARIRRSGGWWANNRISELVGSFVCQPYIFQMHVYWNQWVPGYTTISCEYNLCRRRKCAPSAPEGCDFFLFDCSVSINEQMREVAAS